MTIQDIVFASVLLATIDHGTCDNNLSHAIVEVAPFSYTLIVLNTLSSTILAN